MYVFNESRLTLSIMGHRIKGIGVTYIRHASVMLTRPLFRDKYTIGTLKVFTDRINAERYRDYFVKFHDLNILTMGERAESILSRYFKVPDLSKLVEGAGCKGVELTHWCVATALGCLTSGVKYTPEFMVALHAIKDGGASAAAVNAPDVPLEDTVFPGEADPDSASDDISVPDSVEDSVLEEEAVEAIPENTQVAEAPAETVEAPAETVEAPAETVEAPAETVEAPAETVEAPAETVEAPAETVEAPAETVEAPAETVEAPAETVEAPVDEPAVEEAAPAEEAAPVEKTPLDPAVFDGMSIAAIREWAEAHYPAFAPAKSWTRDKLIDKLIEFASGSGAV